MDIFGVNFFLYDLIIESMSEDYMSVLENNFDIVVKKSKFISNSFFVENESDIKKKISLVKKLNYDASHHVYAYLLLDGTSKSYDDGEPSGTAGVQVLKVINNFNLKNVLIVVTRYFGGTKLGTGGLSRAYFECADLLIKNSKIITKKKCFKVAIEVTYKEYDKIVKNSDFKIIETIFLLNVNLLIAVENSKIDEFENKIECMFSRKLDFSIKGEEYFDF